MKKLILIFALICISLVACQQKIEREARFEELYRHFEKCGLNMRGVYELNEVVAGSNKAIQFMISDRAVGIYFYNLKNPAQAEKLRKIKKEKKLTLLNIPYDAIVNGQYVLVDANDHLEGEKIIDAFDDFE